MTISLTQEKRLRIISLINRLQRIKQCTIRDFARFLGLLTSSCPAVRYGWLYTKSFEKEKFLALEKAQGNFDVILKIPQSLDRDFRWWLDNIMLTNNSLDYNQFAIEIFTDASRTGWGVFCAGKSSYGLWTEQESDYHINYLELLAVYFGLTLNQRG